MTATITEDYVDTDDLTLLDFEAAIPCEDEDCDNEADYKLIMKCCRDTFFCCESCLFEFLEGWRHMRKRRWVCQHCESLVTADPPFIASTLRA